MIRIVEEDTFLGTSKVTFQEAPPESKMETVETPLKIVEIQQSESVLHKTPDLKDQVVNGETQNEEEVLEACMEDTSLADDSEAQSIQEEEIKESNSQEAFKNQIYEDYIQSLNEQIDFLKNQLQEKNKQLNSKDDLILNFQILLKEDRSKIQLLEHELKKEKKPIWRRFFKQKPVTD